MNAHDTQLRPGSRPVPEIRDDVINTEAALGHLRKLHDAMTGRRRFEYDCVVRDAEERLAEFRSELTKAQAAR